MRINKYVAQASGLSRRAADLAISQGRVTLDGKYAPAICDVDDASRVTLDGKQLLLPSKSLTIMLNKPTGYVVSRDGQGSSSVYELLPKQYAACKPVGRLDKDSSGLLLLTNDGQLAQQLTHPRFEKNKTYHITLSKPLKPLHHQMISNNGLQLDDGLSRLSLSRQGDDDLHWVVEMREGRNRQIRRTFEALGYRVRTLHRVSLGPYRLEDLASGTYKVLVVN